MVTFEAYLKAHASQNPDTLKLYGREAKGFTSWLAGRKLTLDTVQEYEAWLRARFKPNSLSNKVVGVNLYLK